MSGAEAHIYTTHIQTQSQCKELYEISYHDSDEIYRYIQTDIEKIYTIQIMAGVLLRPHGATPPHNGGACRARSHINATVHWFNYPSPLYIHIEIIHYGSQTTEMFEQLKY